MSDDLDRLIGVDPADPAQALAIQLVANDHKLLHDLAAHRLAAGLSLVDVAQRMRVRISTVRQLERGDADPTLSTLRRYAAAVGAIVDHTVSAAATQAPDADGTAAESSAPPCLCDHTPDEHLGAEGPCWIGTCPCVVYRPYEPRSSAAAPTPKG